MIDTTINLLKEELERKYSDIETLKTKISILNQSIKELDKECIDLVDSLKKLGYEVKSVKYSSGALIPTNKYARLKIVKSK